MDDIDMGEPASGSTTPRTQPRSAAPSRNREEHHRGHAGHRHKHSRRGEHASHGSAKRKGDTHRTPCRYGDGCRHKSRCEYRHPSDGSAAVAATSHHLLLMCLLVRDGRADAELSESWRLKVDAAVCSAVESLHKFIAKHPTLPLRIIIAGYIDSYAVSRFKEMCDDGLLDNPDICCWSGSFSGLKCGAGYAWMGPQRPAAWPAQDAPLSTFLMVPCATDLSAEVHPLCQWLDMQDSSLLQQTKAEAGEMKPGDVRLLPVAESTPPYFMADDKGGHMSAHVSHLDHCFGRLLHQIALHVTYAAPEPPPAAATAQDDDSDATQPDDEYEEYEAAIAASIRAQEEAEASGWLEESGTPSAAPSSTDVSRSVSVAAAETPKRKRHDIKDMRTQMRDWRVSIMRETFEAVRTGSYTAVDGKLIKLHRGRMTVGASACHKCFCAECPTACDICIHVTPAQLGSVVVVNGELSDKEPSLPPSPVKPAKQPTISSFFTKIPKAAKFDDVTKAIQGVHAAGGVEETKTDASGASVAPPAPLSAVPPAPLSAVPPAPLSAVPPAPLSAVPPAPMSAVPPTPMPIAPPAIPAAEAPVGPSTIHPATDEGDDAGWLRRAPADETKSAPQPDETKAVEASSLHRTPTVVVTASIQAPVHIVDCDCIDAGKVLLDNGYYPVVLNLANAYHAGGGYRTGAAAQEENLHRRTNYFQHLENQDQISRLAPWSYPIEAHDVAYSAAIAVIRGNEANGYPFLSTPHWLSFIAAAAYERPPVENGRLKPKYAAGTERKIRSILTSAKKHKHDAVVLGALGCGAFRNPPEHISELFHNVLREAEFANAFKQVVFAILEDGNSGQAHNPSGNLIPFACEFGAPILGLDDLCVALRTPPSSTAAAMPATTAGDGDISMT